MLSPSERRVDITKYQELFQFFPMLSTEKTPVSSSEGGTFVVGSVGMKNEGARGRGKGRCLLVGQGASNQRRRDLGDLIAVYKSNSVLGLNGNSVEDV
jgi:hypothetical protein